MSVVGVFHGVVRSWVYARRVLASVPKLNPKSVPMTSKSCPASLIFFPMGDSIPIPLAVIIPRVSAIALDPTGLEWANRPNEKKRHWETFKRPKNMVQIDSNNVPGPR